MRGGGSPVWILFTLILMLGAVAWLTWHPEAEIVRVAQEWPLIGPLAQKFRRAYIPPETIPDQSGSVTHPEIHRQVEIVVVEPDPVIVGARPYLWVQTDTPIHAEPDGDSQVLFTTSALANLSILRQEGDWYRVIQPIADKSVILGWVFMKGYQEPQPSRISTPEPVLPLAANSISPGRLLSATRLMAGGGRELDCGPYRLQTDAVSSSLIDLCSDLAGDLEQVYRIRYGLEPVSPPAETILLFATGEDYEAFRDEEEINFEAHVAHSFPSRGYVALYEADRSATQIVSSLIHELTHLLNRRSLGPALPAWLTEGMADDLAESSIDALGRLSPGVLGGEAQRFETLTLRSGGIASLVRLQTLDQLGELPSLRDLIRLEAEEFYQPDQAQLHYALSSFWVRYLLRNSEQELARGFRGYLEDIANGAPITDSLLVERLGADLQTLEHGFRQWLRDQSVGKSVASETLEVNVIRSRSTPAR